jgi:hypothetical protein
MVAAKDISASPGCRPTATGDRRSSEGTGDSIGKLPAAKQLELNALRIVNKFFAFALERSVFSGQLNGSSFAEVPFL